MGCLKLTYRENLTPLKVVHGVFETSGKAGAGVYRYGFNGMEKDDEVKGSGNSYDFGARIYDPRLGKFLSIDPDFRKYPYWSPYLFAANDPIRFIDVFGKGPGDVVVVLAGADLSSNGDVASAGPIASQVVKNSPGTASKAFSSTFWKTGSHWTPYGGRAITIVKERDLDKITQDAYEYIMNNKTEDGKVVVYGYSHGGVLANHLAKRLKKARVEVDLLVTIDAAAGPESDQVDRIISDNVKKNVNIYQRTPSMIESRGDANTAENKNKTVVENKNMTSDDVNHGNIDEKTQDTVIEEITKVVQ